jgi:hypothetical protein
VTRREVNWSRTGQTIWLLGGRWWSGVGLDPSPDAFANMPCSARPNGCRVVARVRVPSRCCSGPNHELGGCRRGVEVVIGVGGRLESLQV